MTQLDKWMPLSRQRSEAVKNSSGICVYHSERTSATMLLVAILLFSLHGGFTFAEGISNNTIPEIEVFLSNETIEEASTLTTTIPKSSEEEIKEIVHEGGCGSPRVVENSRIDGLSGSHYEVGAELTYSCEFGYSSDGLSHVSRCAASEEERPSWSDPGITCIPKGCGDPGYVSNARRLGSRFTFPNQVSFECEDGFKLRGSVTRYCQASGRWSGTLPTCEKIYCDEPFHPTNGRVFFTSLEYGSRLSYECDKGFILRNHETRMCLENGTWSGLQPSCMEAQCEKPESPEHGTVEVAGDNSRVGSIALYRCDSDRILVGSSTSKCLEIGEWTFPTPQCVEPCVVPYISNGAIGSYEATRWSRQKTYTQLFAGTSLKNKGELYLRCDAGYEPLGRNKAEVRIFCENGRWAETPICQPARCNGQPPSMVTGRPVSINRTHTGYVVYHCTAEGFKKTKIGNVTCHFGTWRGIPPICSDTRCYLDRMSFPGLVIGRRRNAYRSKEVFKAECEKGYERATSENKLICKDGSWDGVFPPCNAASCKDHPPPIKNGRIKSYSLLHSSVVKYECDEGYFEQTPTHVQCSFGQWTGVPTPCARGGCYFQSLRFKAGVVVPANDPVEDGENIEVQCYSGFSARNIRPQCSKGQWLEYGTSPCQPNNCPIESIRNGALTELKTKKKWLGVFFGTETYAARLPIGRMMGPGMKAYTLCDLDYTFQGTFPPQLIEVTCQEGRWTPTPVCITPGSVYVEKVEQPSRDRTSQSPTSSTTSSTTQSAEPVAEVVTRSMETWEDHKQDCFCVYQGPSNLVAFSDGESLKNGSKVKMDATVQFRCLLFGHDHFMGRREITCRSNCAWHSSEYPDCVAPKLGDVTFEFDKPIRILPEGAVIIDQGTDLLITCLSYGVNETPLWALIDLQKESANLDTQEPEIGYSVLSIQDAVAAQHNGRYKCLLQKYGSRELQIIVQTKCKQFVEDEELKIHYDDCQRANSRALFSCKKPLMRMEGSEVLTCLSNGEWSGHPPKCLSSGCPRLEETEGLLITYSNEQMTGSTATFHCFIPRERKGSSFAICLPNGQWNSNPPTCTMPRCSLQKLSEQMPENVVVVMKSVQNETVPHGFELPLTCERGLRPTETASAKCGDGGSWEIPTVNCVPGCGLIPLPSDSHLILDPVKEFYRFGEMVSLSCNPGHVLSAETELLMCLPDGWSDTALPQCVTQ